MESKLHSDVGICRCQCFHHSTHSKLKLAQLSAQHRHFRDHFLHCLGHDRHMIHQVCRWDVVDGNLTLTIHLRIASQRAHIENSLGVGLCQCLEKVPVSSDQMDLLCIIEHGIPRCPKLSQSVDRRKALKLSTGLYGDEIVVQGTCAPVDA